MLQKANLLLPKLKKGKNKGLVRLSLMRYEPIIIFLIIANIVALTLILFWPPSAVTFDGVSGIVRGAAIILNVPPEVSCSTACPNGSDRTDPLKSTATSVSKSTMPTL